MYDAMNHERVLAVIREADRLLMAGECLGARKADLVFTWLCPLLEEAEIKLVLAEEDLEEYRQLAKDSGADEGAQIFAKRCLHRLRNLQEQGCIDVMEDPFSGTDKRQALPVLVTDRDHPPLWAGGKRPLTMIEIGNEGEAEILPFGSSGPEGRSEGRFAGWIGKIRKNGLDWLFGDDF